jgi:hypothetical protein
MQPDRRGTGITVVLVVLLVPLAVAMGWFRLRREDRLQAAANERNGSVMLRVIAAAEEEFRNGDRDGNGVEDYWTADVAGLARFQGRTSRPGPLIPPDIAAADAARPGAAPKYGYYVRALDGVGRSGFAFCAYPADFPRSGKWTFVLNEKRQFYRVDTGGEPIRKWAPDSTWLVLD